MAKVSLHVVPQNDDWAVKREGNERASSTHGTQREAIDAARELAKEGDEIVIHRPDGTIREQYTYTGSASAQDAAEPATIRPADVASVGSRVSWAAVFAGVIVALATYVTLNLFAFAVGLSSVDQMAGRNFAAGAALVSAVCLLVSLFIGGFVASGYAVGEDKVEAMTGGVLVWATILLLLVGTGFGMGVGYFAGARDLGRSADPAAPAVGVDPALPVVQGVSPQALAWWTFGGVVFSLFAAVGGALAGAGPELELKRTRSGNVVVTPKKS